MLSTYVRINLSPKHHPAEKYYHENFAILSPGITAGIHCLPRLLVGGHRCTTKLRPLKGAK